MSDFEVTVAALLAREVEVGLLGSTDPHLTGGELLHLVDDRGPQPDEHVVPVARRATLDAAGPALGEAAADVSQRLTDELRALNRRVVVDREPAEDMAREWLAAGP